MSDVMLLGVLKMPYEMAMANDLSRLQFYQRVQQLVAQVEAQPPMPAAPAELLGNPEQLERRQLPTNCRHCGGPDDVICGGQCRRVTDAFADADKVMHPVQEPETAVYIRKDQLQKAAQSAMLCEVTPEPRQDRIRIYTAPPKIETEAAHGITGGAA